MSYRSGARFGPNHIREASRLLRPYNPALDVSPFELTQVADAGDVAVNPFNIGEAIDTIEQAALDLTDERHAPGHPRRRPHHRPAAAARGGEAARAGRRCCTSTRTWTPGTPTSAPSTRTARRSAAPSKRGSSTPRRSATSAPAARSTASRTSRTTAGSASASSPAPTSYHQGVNEVIAKLRDRIGDRPLYISIDIDVLDPAHAPGTGTPGGRRHHQPGDPGDPARLPRPEPHRRRRRRGGTAPTTTPRSPASPRPTSPTTWSRCSRSGTKSRAERWQGRLRTPVRVVGSGDRRPASPGP